MIARDLALALDPVILAEQMGLEPDPWQRDFLRSLAPRVLLNASRQSGKSTATGVLAVHTAVYRPRSLVLLVSPSLRQSSELFRKCLNAYQAAGRPVAPEAETLLRLELENGSRILSLPGGEATIRGFSAPTLVAVDEASRVDDELLTALTPMLATSQAGRLVTLSSPAGRRGWWWRAWDQGGDDWARVRVLATDVPRISPGFLATERRTMSAARYAQEYLCEFNEADAAVFAADAVSQAIDHERAPLTLEVFSRWAS